MNEDVPASVGDPSPVPARDLNADLLAFLRLEDADFEMVRKFYDLLTSDAHAFAESFYNYLNRFTETSDIFFQFEKRGGDIDKLVKSQISHMFRLLRGSVSESYAGAVVDLGRMHHRIGVTPTLLLGAYQLYQSHLHRLVNGFGLDKDEQLALWRSISSLIARDLGLMLEGYRRASEDVIKVEKTKLERFRQQTDSLLENVPPVVWSVDPVTEQTVFEGPGLSRLFGDDITFPIPGISLIHPGNAENLQRAWLDALGGANAEQECRTVGEGDFVRWIRYGFHSVTDSLGEVTRIDCVAEDVTERRLVEDRLASVSTVDELTGLPNRALLTDRLGQAVAAARREGMHGVVLLVLDLNDFKDINRAFGRAVGDSVIGAVGERMVRVLRESDTLARFGGDEFAVLLPRVVESRNAAAQVAENMIKAMALPIRAGEHELNVVGSVGISIFPDDADSSDEMLGHAAVSMQDAKGTAPGFRFYDPRFAAQVRHQMNLATELRQAADRGQLEVYYQPIVDVETGRTSALEALIRWNHPKMGLIKPDQFLPLAERSGSMNQLSEWVLMEALRQIAEWTSELGNLRVAVNMSPRNFQDARIVSLVKKALKETGVASERLTLEVTEHMIMVDAERAADVIRQMNDLGMTVAIDDFGTGYSSLSHLRQFPFGAIKIDKSFLRNVATDAGAIVIIDSIVKLAGRLGFKTVAEGVETKEQFGVAVGLGCDAVQGYWIQPPAPADEIKAWLVEAAGGVIHPLTASM